MPGLSNAVRSINEVFVLLPYKKTKQFFVDTFFVGGVGFPLHKPYIKR